MRTTITIFLFIVCAPCTYGASFDCAKASSQVEKQICSNAELSKLDEQLAIAYAQGNAKSKNKPEFKSSQKRWLIETRNNCADTPCIKDAYEARLREIEQEINSAMAGEDKALLGVWSGNGRASNAIYGNMNIAKKQISWGGTNPYNGFCKTKYTLVNKYTSTTYPDNPFRLVEGRTFTIYKLKLTPQPCNSETLFQFAIPSDNSNYAEVVTYGAKEIQTGWHNFSKVSNE